MARNVADQLIEILAAAGVKRIYGIVGDSLGLFFFALSSATVGSQDLEQGSLRGPGQKILKRRFLRGIELLRVGSDFQNGLHKRIVQVIEVNGRIPSGKPRQDRLVVAEKLRGARSPVARKVGLGHRPLNRDSLKH